MAHEARVLVVDNHHEQDTRTRDRRLRGFVEAIESYNARFAPAGRFVSWEVIPFDMLGSTSIHHDGVILSGSGISMDAIKACPRLQAAFQAEIDLIRSGQVPVLGVCFGHQLIGHAFGFPIGTCNVPEGAIMPVAFSDGFDLVAPGVITVENHHQREIVREPAGLFDATFTIHASTGVCQVQAIKHKFLPLYGVQFHPESLNSRAMPGGRSLIHGFLDVVVFRTAMASMVPVPQASASAGGDAADA